MEVIKVMGVKQQNKYKPMKIHPFIVILGLVTLWASCNIGNKPPKSQGDMFDCHQQSNWDSLSVSNELIGEWEWEHISCYWNPDDDNDNEYRGLTIEFNEDQSLIVREEGLITQASSWKVVDGDANLYALEVDPRVIQLYGRILICDDLLEFNDSYIDGCDNYFRKKD